MLVRIILCAVYPKDNHFSPKGWKNFIYMRFTSFHSVSLSPPTRSLLMPQTCVRTEISSEREREGPWARDSTFTKVSLCLHHLSSPPGTHSHSHSRSQQRNLARTLDWHETLVTQWHAACLKRLESSDSWITNGHWDASCHVWFRICLVSCQGDFLHHLMTTWLSITNYIGKMRLHNKPGILCCHLFFLNSYFCWLHNNPLIRYDVKYQCLLNIK